MVTSPPSRTATRKRPSVSRIHMALVCGVCLVVLSLLAYLGIDESFLSLFPGMKSGSSGSNGVTKTIFGRCTSLCNAHTAKQSQLLSGDLLDRNDLLQMVLQAKERLLQKLKVDYGEEYFERIFVATPSDNEKTENAPTAASALNQFPYRPFQPMSMHGKIHGNPAGNGNDASVRQLHRKLMIKILSAQLAFQEQEAHVEGCNCLKKDARKRQRRQLTGSLQENEKQDSSTDYGTLSSTFSKVVWATGGHSAAAAHGNLFNESYTAFMERDMQDVFGSIGIGFEARNYAMGGTGSAPEMALCFEEVFGTDLDFFSWDYGMLEAGSAERLLHYGYRGGISRGRPTMVGIRVGDSSDRGSREGLLAFLEDLGMPVFYQNHDSWSLMKDAIPETQGLGKDELQALPEFVRNFKCGDALETGDPFCAEDKYSSICPDRIGKANWHPGIKFHAMVGHSLSLFLMEALIGAVRALIDHQTESIGELLAQLQSEDDQAFKKILDAGLSDNPQKVYVAKDLNGTVLESDDFQFDFSLLYKGHTHCHTARLPAQTRFNGFLTESDKVGVQERLGNETYDTGVEFSKTIGVSSNGTMQLAWNPDKRAGRECPVIVAPDYKDFFFVHQTHGPSRLSVPNEAERKAYGYDHTRLLGAFVVILETCDWGKCEPHFLKEEHLAEKKWQMSVNGNPVAHLINIGHGALLAKPPNGRFFPPREDGVFDIDIHVHEPDSFVKISSFVFL